MQAYNIFGFIIWLFTAYIIPWWFYGKYRDSKKAHLLNLSIFSLIVVFCLGFTYIFLIPFENAHLKKPEINISITPINNPCYSSSEYPHHEFHFHIINKKKNSAEVTNLNIEFFFPHTVVKTALNESVYTGGPVRILATEGCRRDGNGEIIERFQSDNQSFSSATLAPLRKKSNIAIFRSKDWPKGTNFYGSITIDLSKRPIFIERPYDIGNYRAIYDYKVGNRVFKGLKLTGKIPQADKKLMEAEFYFSKGLAAFKDDDCNNAVMQFDDTLIIYPEHQYARKLRGLCNGRLGKHNLAFKDFSDYIELEPKDAFGYYFRGISAAYINNCKQAKDDFYKSFELGNNKALKEYLLLSLPEINPDRGFIQLSIDKKAWLEEKEEPFLVIPEVGKKLFRIYAYVDKNNVIRVSLSNSFGTNSELVFDDFKWLLNKPFHPKHSIRIEWGDNKNKLYLDNALVDLKFPVNSKINPQEDTEANLFNSLKDLTPSKGGVRLTISDPKLFEKTEKRIQIIPYVYRNGIELSIYKDIDNTIKALITNQFGSGVILKYDKLNSLPLMPSHPSHSIQVSWSNGKCRLYIDKILSDIYPPNKI